MQTTPHRPSRPAAALALFLCVAVANSSCAMTAIMVTDHRERRIEQYRLLWVDAAVVGAAVGVGAPLYALSESYSTREDVGQGLLWGALGWAAWTVFWFALLRMPDSASQARATPSGGARSRMTNSTRRLSPRPRLVSLEATGRP